MNKLRPPRAEELRATLWFWPLTAATAALLVTPALARVRPGPEAAWGTWLWPAGHEAASTLLQVVATSIMTATTLTFSLTVVALQLASQQFSPRLLREFARDRATQGALAVLVSTFVVSLTGLRALDPERPVPVVLVFVVLALGLLSAGTLLVFVGHIVRALRVDTMMVSVHREAASIIAQTYPDYGDTAKKPRAGLPAPATGHLLVFSRSGFVRVVDPGHIAQAAARHGVFVRVGVRPGDLVANGSPAAEVWGDDDRGVDVDVLAQDLLEGIELGFERTVEQDAALGLRQLTDIAVKAISPGINDPVTAAHAVGYCADLLLRLQGRQLGEQEHLAPDGEVRLVTPDRDHRYYLDLVCAPVRRYGREEPLVLTSLLRLLRDCALQANDDEQRREVARQTDLVLGEISDVMQPDDADAVRDLARRVGLVLSGEVAEAFRDRAGETRSV